MVALAFYNYSHLSALHYQLDEVQGRFTTTADLALSRISHRNIQGDFSARSVTVLYNGRAVGFFVLDFGTDKLDFTENDDSVLLRSLSVNPELGAGVSAEKQWNCYRYLLKNSTPAQRRSYWPSIKTITVRSAFIRSAGTFLREKRDLE